MYKMLVVKNHWIKTFIISSTNRCKKVVYKQKTNFLVVKFVDLANIKDLEIDLADKKLYLLDNDANKVKYCYY